MRKAIDFLTTSSLALLLCSAALPAQQRATLDQVEAQMKSNQLEQARTTLDRWRKANARAGDEDNWRATYLTARLALNAKDAEEAYLNIAISAPASNRYVPEALLRVGQAELLAGSGRNAVSYLKRVVDNYPKSEFAATAAEWLQRAQTQTPVKSAVGTAPTSADRWTVQVAAFREESGAKSVARQIEKKGFSDVRVVTVPDNALWRVRVGHFKTASSALDAVAKLKQAGFSAVAAGDAARETRAHE